MTISYTITPLNIAAHLFSVELSITDPDPAGQVVYLPVWIPGSYLIREFARHIVSIQAESAGQPLALEKCDKSSWRAEITSSPLLIRYVVYAFDLSVRGAYLDSQRAFFNGTSVFLAVQGQEQQSCELTIVNAEQTAWRVASTLTAQQIDEAGFGVYRAENYDELIDHPVEMSDFTELEFIAAGVPHRMVISGRHQADLMRLAADLQRICEYQIQLFGTPAPFNEYLFLTLAVGEGYGGLEHRSSTALICNRNDLSTPQSAMSAGYRQFLGLCSHEYFHSWNVKRIKPAAYAPYDLRQENYTRLLWAFEGITSYYDDLTLLRAGLISVPEYLELLSQTITSVERGQGQAIQHLEDASFDAWVKYYRQDENSPNALVSYYTKGALFALCLDLTIRRETQGQQSLDDVMRALWQEYGQDFATQQRGIAEQEWEALAQRITGLDLAPLFELGLRSTAALPLRQLLGEFGVDWQQRAAISAADKGGWRDALSGITTCSLGVRTTAEPLGVKLTHVMSNSAAQQAGLSAGDVLIAWDGLRLTASSYDSLLATAVVGQHVSIHAFRRDELLIFNLQLAAQPVDTIGLKVNANITQDILTAQSIWLRH